MITRDNYEIYFVDYLEGNLSDSQVDMVELFLKNNPDLAEELALFSRNEVEDNQKMEFGYLKKQFLINSSNEEEYFIGAIEKQLTKEEERDRKSGEKTKEYHT